MLSVWQNSLYLVSWTNQALNIFRHFSKKAAKSWQMYSRSRPRDVLQVSIRHVCLGGFLLTSQGAIKKLNLHKHSDLVNSLHKDLNKRNDVIRLFLVVSHTLINLHAFLKNELPSKRPNTRRSLSKQGFSAISQPDKTIWAVWLGEATNDKQIEHCVWVDHVLKDRRVAKISLTVSWRDHSFHCWVTVAGLHCGSWRLLGV